jgi:GDPmannose 4,6-dehydratase
MSIKRALVTGITGMDGSHLSEFLLAKGYEVYGMERRSSLKHYENIENIKDKIEIITGDLCDQNSLSRAIKLSDPEEIYNLASQSFVAESWNTPEYTSNVTGLGVLRILEAIREYEKPIKFYQASSSEMFGRMVENPANENTPFS